MRQVEQRTHAVRAWLISVIAHVLLFVLVFPGGGQSAGTGTLLEVGIVAMTGQDPANLTRNQLAATAALASEDEKEPPQSEPEETLEGEPLPPIPEGPSTKSENAEKTPATEAQARTEDIVNPSGGNGTPTLGSGSGTGRGPGYGSGAGFVLNGPLYYPKNVQNEGVEGRVRLAVILWPTGQVKAEITESSGDQRLDNYSLRAVTEAWRYLPTQEPLRIMMSLTFKNGKVDIDFEGSTPWSGEESRP